jgi:crotonobetainyl-CoA:carnitine CoA-transferase CaiB-like acyl-CoA transferase
MEMELLTGVKVVDLTAAIAGTFGTLALADLGADVIKIEPLKGEHYRTALSGAIVIAMNRNKRGVALDLKTKEGQDIVLNLVRKADVFIENFVPGTIEKLGLSYERVKEVKPDIIYCSVSGFGQDGPMSRRPSYDPVAQAMAGIMIATGDKDGKPCRQVTSLIDMTAGLYAAIAILASLNKRHTTGQGERIDISMLDTAVSAMNYFLTWHSVTGNLPTRQGSGTPGWTPYEAFDTKDNPVWIGVSTDKFWQAFCRALHLDELAKDERYLNDTDRRDRREELVAKVAEICRQYTSEELDRRLQEVGVPVGVLATVAEVPDNPQVQFRHLIDEFCYPGKGKVKAVKTPIMVGGSLPEAKRQAPLIGEHTVEVLREHGYGDSDIQGFISRGVAMQHTA